jgi:hypothetical protein
MMLSTGSLAVAIRRDAVAARLDVIHAIPAGAEMVGAAVIDRLTPTTATTAQAVVSVSERVQLADGASETPLVERYRAVLDRTRRGWRTAAFTPER